MYFDTHAHLNFSRFKKNVDEVISSSKSAGVAYFVVPGTDIESSQKAIEIANANEGIYAAVGIHPHHVFNLLQVPSAESRVKEEIQEIGSLLELETRNSVPETKTIVAIGEIGLDRHHYENTKYENYHTNDSFIDLQKELFTAQLNLARKYDKSIIVHNREAKQDLLPILKEQWNSHFEGRMVFHCCEPDPELLEFAKKHTIFIGIDGDVTYREDKQEFIKTVPLEMLVLETDSPFLLPEPQRSQKLYPNTPAHLPLIAEFIAHLRKESVETFQDATTNNARRLFLV